MKFLKSSHGFLFGANIIFIILAYNGFFEGKDLLPILIAILTTILSIVFFLKNRTIQIKIKTLGTFAVLLSAIWLYHTHFNIFSAQRIRISEENSIQVLNNKKAPTLTFTESVNFNKTLSIDSLILNNKFTILNFWATWCAPCLKEMPLLNEFHKNNQDKPIGLIGFTDYVSKDTAELTKIKKLIDELNISYPMLIDSSTNVRIQYKADVLPATVLIDGKGNVIDYQIGINGAEQIMSFVNDELGDK